MGTREWQQAETIRASYNAADRVALQPGSTLGPYEVIALIGAGGMGEVYRARDPRLGREVAIKVLPDAFTADAQRLSRFEREARLLAALNHPNIGAIYGLEESGHHHALVLELIEGPTLAARLGTGPLPLQEALLVARGITDALEAAHEKGVIHRDLKPANIKITPDGTVKVLDFGLAKFHASGGPPQDLSATRTPAVGDTRDGQILGTPAYMSPEQVRSQPLDRRTDIWAFGCVLFEMLTGRTAFTGETLSDNIAAILHRDPDWRGLPPTVPESVQRLLRRCLEKNVTRRLRDIADARFDLEEALAGTTLPQPALEADSALRRRVVIAGWPTRSLVLGVGALLLAAALVITAFTVTAAWRNRSESAAISRAVPVAYRLVPVANDAVAEFQPSWSPDGQSLAYVAEVDGKFQIFARALSASAPVQLTPTQSSARKSDPFWSTDGSRVYYLDNHLYSVGAAGGQPELLYKDVSSAALSRDGKVLALLRHDASIWLSSPPGSEPRPYLEAPFTDHHFDTGILRFSPQGDRLVAWMWQEGKPTEFWVLPLPRGKPFQVLRNSTADCLFPQPFSVLPDGRHIVLEMQPRPDWTQHLVVADLERDVVQPLTRTTHSENQPALSPAGDRIAFTVRDSNYDLVVVPLDGSPMRDFLATAWYEGFPSWRTNGEVAYVSSRRGGLEIWLYDPRSGWNRPAVARDSFEKTDSLLLNPAISPEGQRIAYERFLRGGRPISIWISALAGGTSVALTPGSQERTQGSPSWSPDGKWVAYVATRGATSVLRKAQVGSSGQPIALYEGPLGRIRWSPRGDWIASETGTGLTLVNAHGGENRVLTRTEAPVVFGWSADGALIYGLRAIAGKLVLVSIDVETGREKRIAEVGAAPRLPMPVYLIDTLSGFGLSPDGKSFLTSVNRSGSDIWILEGFRTPANSP